MKICLSCEGVVETAAARCGHCAGWLLPTEAVHYPERRGEVETGNPLLGAVVDGKYRLQSVLGRGGLGTVFEAVHIGSLLTVALKLLHPRFSERPEYRRALLPEARRAATIAHERCARLLDVGETEDGATYLAMELVVGETLEQTLREGPLLPGHVLTILTQIAEALVAIHAAGLVHCDLSPRNVMVAARDGRLAVKVLDFGIARTVSMAGAERVRGGEFAGFVNPLFAAPEQLAGQPVDARADLYAFGVLGRLLLTGELPFPAVEPQQAARAALAGELRPWPHRTGVPRPLQRLLQACLQRDRDARPGSAVAVLAELQQLAAPPRPVLAPLAVAVAAVVVVAWSWVLGRPQAPFFWAVAGSALDLAERLPGPGAPVQCLPSRSVATLSCHFGGFAPERLSVDLSRDGVLLRHVPLQPEGSARLGIATLSTAQPGWRDVLQSLLSSSREGPVDLAFAVPGGPPLAAARLRLDDDPPLCEARLVGAAGALVADTLLQVRIDDASGVAAARFEVRLASGSVATLDWSPRNPEVPLGRALRAVLPGVVDHGAGELTAVAVDLAGNTTRSEPLAFTLCDLEAPTVLDLTGPAGEPHLPILGELVRARVRLSAAEPGAELRLEVPGAGPVLLAQLEGGGTWQVVSIPRAAFAGAGEAGVAAFVVVDAAGNRSRSQHAYTLRERALGLQWVADTSAVAVVGGEVVMAADGGDLRVQHRSGVRLRAAAIEGLGGKPLAAAVTDGTGPAANLSWSGLEPGSGRLRLQFVTEDGTAEVLEEVVPLRVLPARLEVRLPAVAGRFLGDFLQAGILARQGRGVVDGSAWRWPGELRPYVNGRLWVGTEPPVAMALVAADPGQALLPEVPLVPGRNRLALELRDVLGRTVIVSSVDGLLPLGAGAASALPIVADFWWDETPPEPIGEEFLVEPGQPTRWRVRLPLPYTASEAVRLRASLAQAEVPATSVVPAGSGAIATFELPFAAVASATQLDGLPRSEFARQLERRLLVSLRTPSGANDFELRLRTARSTLRSARLGELAALPAALAVLRMVPVLAPEQPFAVPLPKDAPPRGLYRPPGPVQVRAIADFALLEQELSWGAARALAAGLAAGGAPQAELVHADDPLGVRRLDPAHLLPRDLGAGEEQLLAGVDFFQAYTLCRVLGWLAAGDPGLFRLPLGCELELAAFGSGTSAACNGPAAGGRPVRADAFAVAAGVPWQPSAVASAAVGDRVKVGAQDELFGLDFGLREWVADLPFCAEAEALLSEWTGDHGMHLARVAAFAAGQVPSTGLPLPLRTLGVVRGLAFDEPSGLLGSDGRPLALRRDAVVPASVPGVLRAEQLRRDGRDLLTGTSDRRLARIGFRVAGGERFLAWLRGQR